MYTVDPINAMDYECVVRLCTPRSSKYTKRVLSYLQKDDPRDC